MDVLIDIMQRYWLPIIVIGIVVGFVGRLIYRIWEMAVIAPAHRQEFITVFGQEPKRGDRDQLEFVCLELETLRRQTEVGTRRERQLALSLLRGAVLVAEFYFGYHIAWQNPLLAEYLPRKTRRELQEARRR